MTATTVAELIRQRILSNQPPFTRVNESTDLDVLGGDVARIDVVLFEVYIGEGKNEKAYTITVKREY